MSKSYCPQLTNHDISQGQAQPWQAMYGAN